LPASDINPVNAYLEQVEMCDIYLGLFGKEYGMKITMAFLQPKENITWLAASIKFA